MGVDKLAIMMVFSIPLVAIVGGLSLAALKILKGKPDGKASLNDEEAALIQDLCRVAQRLEKRVEALETLLMDRVREEKVF